jgi:hypothetical protein
MFVWEVLAHRLRLQGWNVWRTTYRDDDATTHLIHLERAGEESTGTGPTLTEAIADAIRKNRKIRAEPGSDQPPRPHLVLERRALAQTTG